MAFHLGRRVLPQHTSKFSRMDYTLPQLFACLVLREFEKKSYRKTEQLLADCPNWRRDIGLKKTPDHNTLWRAFDAVTQLRYVNRMMHLLSQFMWMADLLGLSKKPLSIDSTIFEIRHVSRHYEQRCRQMAQQQQREKDTVNQARSRKVRQLPKLASAVAANCHFILAARARTGNASDQLDFAPLLRQACRRARVRTVVLDAGYDSEKNHRIARLELKVRSIIPPRIGRPTDKPPTGRFRRLMYHRFKRRADARECGQRAQSETVQSMLKRNLGSAMRSIRPDRRQRETLLRVITHNVMLCCPELRGSRLSR